MNANPTSKLNHLYGGSLALLTDLYQLTMAAGYLHSQLAEREAVFHLAFRRAPFGGEYAIAAGMADVVDFLNRFKFTADDLAYLASLRGAANRPLFDEQFLDYLRQLKWQVDLDALPEGTVVFGHEPLIRVRGPLLQCQLLETPLLTLVNFPTLIATKASRIVQAAAGDPVLEFGLRRAQGIDGGITAARAAIIGGCSGTSNVLAGRLFDIDVKGTHAHSWVMAFDDEAAAFDTYTQAMPHNSILLVDTYDTLSGVRHAIDTAQTLHQGGHQLLGIRLDSGDLASLSIAARQLLDEAGLTQAKIVASNDLDEYEITRLKAVGARIDIWGVGTRLTTAYEQPALGGVYKMAAMADASGNLQPKIKLSNEPIKTSNPGVQQVRRFHYEGRAIGDCIYDETFGIDPDPTYTLFGAGGAHSIHNLAAGKDLLRPIFREGHQVADPPSLPEIQTQAAREIHSLPVEVTRLDNPQPYAVGLEDRLLETKLRLMEAAVPRN